MDTLTVHIDDELLCAMEEEGDVVGDATLGQTIARRLSQGVSLARIVGANDLLWRPVRNGAQPFAVELPRALIARLEDLAEQFDYPPAVLVCTILYNDACKPWEVREAEQPVPFGPVTWQPGRGNIYSMRFDLPGYQIVFLKLLSPRAVERDQIVGEALLALARQVRQVGAVAGRPVSDEAFEFAGKMIRNADLRRRGGASVDRRLPD